MRRYSITILVGIVLSLLIMILQNITKQETTKDVIRVITNATFIAGILIGGSGLLVFSSNSGTFDMITYGLRRATLVFRKKVIDEKYRTFYDYSKSRSEAKISFGHLIITGIMLISISLIFLGIYENLS